MVLITTFNNKNSIVGVNKLTITTHIWNTASMTLLHYTNCKKPFSLQDPTSPLPSPLREQKASSSSPYDIMRTWSNRTSKRGLNQDQSKGIKVVRDSLAYCLLTNFIFICALHSLFFHYCSWIWLTHIHHFFPLFFTNLADMQNWWDVEEMFVGRKFNWSTTTAIIHRTSHHS